MANRAIRTHHGPSTGWRAVFDLDLWRQAVIAGTAGALSMAVLACAVALARDTTGHDWYAAYKVTVADLLIGAGFDEGAPVEYRNADGVVETVSRFGLTVTLEARWAREDILGAAWNGAALGALSGFGGALLCLVLMSRSRDERRAAYEPASAPERPKSLPPSPTTAAPTHAPADRLPVGEPPRSAKPEPTATRQGKPDAGKERKAAPDRRKRGKSDYGRWI